MKSDTPPDVEERLRRMLAERTPAERLRMCTGMFATAKALARAGIRARHGALGELELRLELFFRFYAADTSAADCMAIAEALGRRRAPPGPCTP